MSAEFLALSFKHSQKIESGVLLGVFLTIQPQSLKYYL